MIPSKREANWMTRILRVLRAQRDARLLIATWSKETEKKIIDEQSHIGSKMVEHAYPNEYDLVLWENEKVFGTPVYMVSLNAGEFDPFDKSVVNKKIPADSMVGQKKVLEEIISTLRDWINKYGQLAIGSPNNDKAVSYFKIIMKYMEKDGLKFKPISEEKPNLGFFIYL